MMESIIGLVVVSCIFGPRVINAVFDNLRKMEEVRQQRVGGGNSATADEIKALRHELMELRDTATKFDMSFDATLQRMDNRLSHVEGRISQIEQAKEADTQGVGRY